MKKALAWLLVSLMCLTSALAESISLEGTVVATRSSAVLSPSAGVVQDVLVHSGDRVTSGTEIATLMETITYAEISGMVRVCAEAGESTDTVVSRNGAVVYIQPDALYTVSASTKNAYDQLENKIIELGETVYVRSTSVTSRTGMGTVTAIDSSSYTVELTQGNLAVSDSVYIYRSSAFDSTTRIGKGTATYCYPVAYTGSGTVSQILVEDGAYVSKGTPLFSTIDAGTAYSTDIRSTISGTVASIAAEPGTAVEAGSLVATVYPDDAIRLEVLADEIDLRSLSLGQSVTLTFDNGITAQGTVERISGVQYTSESEEDDTVYFPVYIAFQAEEQVACGMTARVTTAE